MTAPRLLVTGASGFVGSWVLEHWKNAFPPVELWATSNRPRPAHLQVHEYRQLDLRDGSAVRELVRSCRPTAVVHVAGLVGAATLEEHLSSNVVGTACLYEAMAAEQSCRDTRVVQVSSAAVYGPVPEEALPIAEDRPLSPITPYAISKAAQEHLALAAAAQYGLQIVRARVFNLLGPDQPVGLVPMAFVGQLRQIQAGRSKRLRVGNLEPRRDFVDVRDVARAIDLLLRNGRAGQAYNVAGGADVSIGELVDRLLAISGMKVPVECEARRKRAADVPRSVADIRRIQADAGWAPALRLEDSLRDVWQQALEGSAEDASPG